MASTEVVDDDTEAAIVALWGQTQALTKAFPNLPRTGRLKKDAGQSIPTPYAQLDCKQGPKPNERMTGGVRHDYREVTITIRGTRAEVVAGTSAVLGVFNRKLGDPNYPAANGLPVVLTFPSGARFIQWWPLNDGAIEEEVETKAGKDVWKGIVRGQVWSVRTD